MFNAEHGKGAFLNWIPIHVNTNNDESEIIFIPRIRNQFDADWNLNLSKIILQTTTICSVGSVAIHYCYVACGRSNCAITLNKDTFPEFAGKLILEEAGGVLTNFNGDELTKDTRGILATRKDFQSKYLKILSLANT